MRREITFWVALAAFLVLATGAWTHVEIVRFKVGAKTYAQVAWRVS